MGSNKSTLSESKMKTCMEVTFLSRSEINRVHRLYKSLQKAFDTEPPFSVTDRVRCTTLRESAQFANNPLGALLLRAFSGDGNRTMSFDEMLDLFSVFGRRAPFHVKCIYAFRIYDVDQDGVIGYDDIYDLTVLVSIRCMRPLLGSCDSVAKHRHKCEYM